jgi:hypothetical protein
VCKVKVEGDKGKVEGDKDRSDRAKESEKKFCANESNDNERLKIRRRFKATETRDDLVILRL